jgi:hypothetical protein
MARTSASSRPLTDHDEIRRWAEQRDAKPVCVRGTGDSDDVGMIRLDFPGYSGEGKLEEISWDEWFQKFDESGLALLVQEKTARGQQSNFNKLVSRETAGVSDEGSSSSRRHSRGAGSTPTEVDEEEFAELEEDISGENASEDESADEDFEEETELEEMSVGASGNRGSRSRNNRSSRKTQSTRKSPGRVSAREEGTRGSRTSARGRGAQSADGRNRRQKASRSRSAGTRRQATSSRSRSSSSGSSAKKAPARAKSTGSRSSRGRSSSSRKRAA